jgi:hypothetical protein
MEHWKKALVAGSIGTGAVLLLKGKRVAGVVMAGLGAVVLASEYPDKLDELRARLPECTGRLMEALERLSRAGEKFAELIENRGHAALERLRPYRQMR